MPITRIRLEKFTAFEKLDLALSPGINVLIGANGTGKTHLMKAAYAACDVSKTQQPFADKLLRVFLPSQRQMGRLVKRAKGSAKGLLAVESGQSKIQISFSNHATVSDSATVTGAKQWCREPIESVYIPVKEMLSHAPGFRSLYTAREIHFEEMYADIVDRAYRPALRGPMDSARKKLLKILRECMEGSVLVKDEEFFLRSKQGNLEFTLLAEGIRKLGLLWLLIQNGTLLQGSVLLWDEPEANLNPQVVGTVMEILLELQRSGVQVFLATHDYVVLKELDLRAKDSDAVQYHSLYRGRQTGEIQHHSVAEFLQVHPNAIADTFADLYNREVERSLSGEQQ